MMHVCGVIAKRQKRGRFGPKVLGLNYFKEWPSNLAIQSTVSVAEHSTNNGCSKPTLRLTKMLCPLISKLKNAGFKLIAISNVSSGKNLKTYLRRAGIPNYFDAIIASAMLDARSQTQRYSEQRQEF